MEEGPTKGFTLTFISCAIEIKSAPGSAIPGHPASEIKPILFPFRHGSKKDFISLFTVNLFNVLTIIFWLL